jgi:outer membrane receptor protein involved in Fe transport
MAGDRDFSKIPLGFFAPGNLFDEPPGPYTLGSTTIPAGRIVLGSGVSTDEAGNVAPDTLPTGARGVSDPSASTLYNTLIETCPTANVPYTVITNPDGTTELGPAAGTRLACTNSYIVDPSESNGWRNFRGAGLDFEGGDGYNFQPENYLLTPQERIQLFAIGDRRFGDVARGYFEASYVNRQSGQDLAPEPFLTDIEGIVVSGDNIYNPFGREIGAVRRRLLEFGRRRDRQDRDTFRLVGGVDGSLPEVFGPAEGWFWDASLNYGRSQGTELKQGRLLRSRLEAAVGPSFIDPGPDGVLQSSPGGLLEGDDVGVCGTPEAPIEGCVPLDLFHGAGTIAPDQIAGLTYAGTRRSVNKLFAAQVNLSGELFELPTSERPLGVAVGYEHRRVSGRNVPDPITVLGDTTGNKETPTIGGYDVNEGYAELSVPVLSARPFAEELEVTVAARAFDYSTFGSDWTYKLGGRWRIIPDVTIRGTYSTAFRAPAVDELFQGLVDDFPSLSDPCADTTGNPQLATVCGAASNNGDEQTQLRSQIGGNPDLQPETADIYTVGVVIEPRWVRNLSLTVDYFNVEVRDSITDIGAAVILEGCYPAEAGGVPNQDYCALITRDPDTQLITNILNRDTNVGGDKGAGIDVAVRYALPTEYGRFGFAVDGTWLQRFNRTLADGTLIRARNTFDLGSGDVGGVYPDFKFNAGVRWGWKGYGAGVTTRYIDSYKECGDSFGDFFGGGLCYADSTFSRKVDSYNTWDLFLSYALRSRLGRTDVGVGMNNVFDEEPPFVYNGFIAQTDPTAYDFVGRFVYLRVAQTL